MSEAIFTMRGWLDVGDIRGIPAWSAKDGVTEVLTRVSGCIVGTQDTQ